MNNVLAFLRGVPTYIWLMLCLAGLITCYYIRPDPVTVDMLHGFSAALLLALNAEHKTPPPPPPPSP